MLFVSSIYNYDKYHTVTKITVKYLMKSVLCNYL